MHKPLYSVHMYKVLQAGKQLLLLCRLISEGYIDILVDTGVFY